MNNPMTSNPPPPKAGQAQTHTPTPVKYYDLAVIRTDTTQRKLTGYPMTHEECCTMKSKFSEEEQSRIIFVPAHPIPDPDHGPMGNQEAELDREINFLKEKLAVAQSAQDAIWKANIELAKQAREDGERISELINERDSLKASHSSLLASHERLKQAADNGMNTIRSLITTLETADSDERYRAREEKRSAYVHTREIKQAYEAYKKLETALSTAHSVNNA